MLLKLVAIPVDVSRILQKKSVEAVDLVMKVSEERLSGSRDGLRRTTGWEPTSSAVTQKWIFPESFERRRASY